VLAAQGGLESLSQVKREYRGPRTDDGNTVVVVTGESLDPGEENAMPSASGTLKMLEEVIEQSTGEKVEEMRRETIADRRARIERTSGKKLRLTRNFPFIGRGNVLRDRVKTAEEIDREFLKSLKDD
jgi:hypothetical protein